MLKARRLVMAAFGVVLILAALPSQLSAVSGSALKMSPVRQSLTISPGKSGQIRIHISNPTDQAITLQPVVDDFTTLDSSGTPALYMGDVGPSARSFKQLVGNLDEITLPPESDKEINIKVEVPEASAPGGYYGAIRLVSSADTNAASSLSTNAASLVLLTVPGDVHEQLTVDSFRVDPSGRSFGRFWLGGSSAKIVVTFNNQGDVHEAPVGQIFVKHGGEVIQKIDFNQKAPKSSILPGSTRSWQFDIDGLEQFGRYEIGAVFTYGSSNQSIELNQTFWMVPFWYLIGAGVALVLVAMLLTSILLRRSSRSSS